MRILLYSTLAIAIFILLTFGLAQIFELETYFVRFLENAKTHQPFYILMSIFIMAADIWLPVPSSLVMLLNGNVLGIVGGLIVSFIGCILASFIGYFTGRFMQIFVLKFVSKEEQEKADALFRKYGAAIIILSRAVPVLCETISIQAGMRKQPFFIYLFYNVLGYVPVCVFYAVCGRYISATQSFVLTLLVSIAMVFFLFKNIPEKNVISPSKYSK